MRSRTRSLPTLCLLLLAACGGDPDPAPAPTADGAGAPAPAADAAPTAALSEAEVAAAQAIYRKANCFGCHGHDAAGGLAGPTLTGLAAHWSPEDLADFIQDPNAWVQKDERIAAMAQEYAMPMARPMVPITPAERLQLARWLLSL